MKGATLKIELRDKVGKVNSLRREGYIPSVVYGKNIDSIPVKIKVSDFREGVSRFGKNAVFSIDLGSGTPFPVVIKDVQYDVLKNDYKHIDFQQVSLTEKRRAEVPVRIVGREKLESAGNIINLMLDVIEIECLPQDTPEWVEVDVQECEAGDTISAGQIKLPDNVELYTDPEEIIIKINEPKAEAGTAEVVAEPEVITEE
ncbi:MAG TPA: 50S ribosomal protein L25 [Clostridiaceae bacterium]|nr:50S ribosomal protein L25 [Clostridiaceae bacterium]